MLWNIYERKFVKDAMQWPHIYPTFTPVGAAYLGMAMSMGYRERTLFRTNYYLEMTLREKAGLTFTLLK